MERSHFSEKKKQRSLGYYRRKHWMHYQSINALGSGSESRAQFPQNKQKDTYKSAIIKNSLNAIANMRQASSCYHQAISRRLIGKRI